MLEQTQDVRPRNMHYIKSLIDEKGLFEMTLKIDRGFEFSGIELHIDSINIYCDGYEYPVDVSVSHNLDDESCSALYYNHEYRDFVCSLTNLPLDYTELMMQTAKESTFETEGLSELLKKI